MEEKLSGLKEREEELVKEVEELREEKSRVEERLIEELSDTQEVVSDYVHVLKNNYIYSDPIVLSEVCIRACLHHIQNFHVHFSSYVQYRTSWFRQSHSLQYQTLQHTHLRKSLLEYSPQ